MGTSQQPGLRVIKQTNKSHISVLSPSLPRPVLHSLRRFHSICELLQSKLCWFLDGLQFPHPHIGANHIHLPGSLKGCHTNESRHTARPSLRALKRHVGQQPTSPTSWECFHSWLTPTSNCPSHVRFKKKIYFCVTFTYETLGQG